MAILNNKIGLIELNDLIIEEWTQCGFLIVEKESFFSNAVVDFMNMTVVFESPFKKSFRTFPIKEILINRCCPSNNNTIDVLRIKSFFNDILTIHILTNNKS